MYALILLTACIDTGLSEKDDVPGLDTGDPIDPPIDDTAGTTLPTEECNGVDDDGDGMADEGFPDADGNGRVDCLDLTCPPLTIGTAGPAAVDAACEGTVVTPVVDAWDVAVKWTFAASSDGYVQSAVAPMVGQLDDDDGDGRIDDHDTPDIVLSLLQEAYGPAAVVAIDGATGVEKWSYPDASFISSVAIADVDADGRPDVATYDAEGHPIALDGAGNVKWTSAASVPIGALPGISVADLDGDATPEVIAYDLVLDGATGVERFRLDLGTARYTGAAVADIDLDGDQEIAFAGRLYSSDGALLWDSLETGTWGMWPVFVQADADPEAEVGFVGAQWTLWEADLTNLARERYGSTAHPGPPCAADFDGDGETEVAWASFLDLGMYELDGTPVWSARIDDESGVAGCSGFDVDGDGVLELLYADESDFRIFDGATGAILYTSADHESGTAMEYPTVADLDGDGHAEMLFVNNQLDGLGHDALTVLEHAGDGWPPAGSVWPLHDFAMGNVAADGTVPVSAYWSEFGVFRARLAADEPAHPNLQVQITDVCVADCTYGPVQLSYQVWNTGAVDVGAGASVSLFAADDAGDRLLRVDVLPAVPAASSLEGVSVELSVADIGTGGFYAVVDLEGGIDECDESDNTGVWADSACP